MVKKFISLLELKSKSILEQEKNSINQRGPAFIVLSLTKKSVHSTHVKVKLRFLLIFSSKNCHINAS